MNRFLSLHLLLPLLVVLLLLPLLLPLSGCVTPSPPPGGPPPSQSGPAPDQIAALVYQSALLGVATGKAAVVAQGDGGACLALSIADGSLRTGYQVFTEARAEQLSPDGVFQPPSMVIDASVCVPLGIPSPELARLREPELRAAAAMGAAGARSVAVMLCSSFGSTSPECYGSSWSAAVVDAGLEGWDAVVAALDDEAEHQDGIVMLELPELAYPTLTSEESAADGTQHIVASADGAPVQRWAKAAGSIREALLP